MGRGTDRAELTGKKLGRTEGEGRRCWSGKCETARVFLVGYVGAGVWFKCVLGLYLQKIHNVLSTTSKHFMAVQKYLPVESVTKTENTHLSVSHSQQV